MSSSALNQTCNGDKESGSQDLAGESAGSNLQHSSAAAVAVSAQPFGSLAAKAAF